jgi:hypothetical protein
MELAGLEPAISGLQDQRLADLATTPNRSGGDRTCDMRFAKTAPFCIDIVQNHHSILYIPRIHPLSLQQSLVSLMFILKVPFGNLSAL